MIKSLYASFFVALLLLSSPLSAAPIIVDFTGTIYTVGSSISGDGVSVGDTVTGRFIYDTLSPDSNPSPDYGNYMAQSFEISFSSGFSASSLSTSITVQNDQQNGSATQPADGLITRANSVIGDSLNGRSVEAFQFGLRRENLLGHLWMDDYLPDLNDWALVTLADINAPDWHWMQFDMMADNSIFDSQIRLDITDLSVSRDVPEPAVLGLLGFGLLLMGFTRRRALLKIHG